MTALYLYFRTWLQSQTSEEGQDLVEYALLLGLIALVAIVAIGLAGQAIQGIWDRIVTALGTVP